MTSRTAASALAIAAAALTVLALGFVGVAPFVHGAGGHSDELQGHHFVGTKLVVDGASRQLSRADGIFLNFAQDEESLSATYPCHNFFTAYRVKTGRLVPVGDWGGTDIGDPSKDCLNKAASAESLRLNDFTLAGPAFVVSGSDLVLRGPGIELTLFDRAIKPDTAASG